MDNRKRNQMNGYNLTRHWFNYKFDNPNQFRSVHAEMYFYLVDLWNRLGQKKVFGLPTDVTMEALEIGSYKTYKKTFDKLVEHGFIIEIQKSKNIHVSRKIALAQITNVNTNALDNANINANTNPITDEGTSIIKQETTNNKTNNNKRFKPPTLLEIENFILEKKYKTVSAQSFWNFYDSKNWMVGKNKMKNWKSAISGWESRNGSQNKNKDSPEASERNEKVKNKLAKYG